MVFCLAKNKLTMFRAHCPFIPLYQLAESKVVYDLGFIRDIDRFVATFQENERVIVRLIKH